MLILGTNVMHLVNEAWENSFAQVESNWAAIAARRWGPLNRNILTNKDILKTKPRVVIENDTAIESATSGDSNNATTNSLSDIQKEIINSINTTTGFMGTVMIDLLQEELKTEAMHKTLHQHQQIGKMLNKSLLKKIETWQQFRYLSIIRFVLIKNSWTYKWRMS